MAKVDYRIALLVHVQEEGCDGSDGIPVCRDREAVLQVMIANNLGPVWRKRGIVHAGKGHMRVICMNKNPPGGDSGSTSLSHAVRRTRTRCTGSRHRPRAAPQLEQECRRWMRAVVCGRGKGVGLKRRLNAWYCRCRLGVDVRLTKMMMIWRGRRSPN